MDDTGWVRVSSTNVAAIRHVGAPINLLYVRFKDGGVYEYASVPRDVYYRMFRAASKGKFVWRVLRGGRRSNPPYEVTKL